MRFNGRKKAPDFFSKEINKKKFSQKKDGNRAKARTHH
tara:strand:+ start:914 stop:1027 length:114 start_codon:yes stop_codon:yes gene_type:complete